jgi:NAD(P)-dependent dehydrogenase (short-subunit alcohol dehydrogenase family)
VRVNTISPGRLTDVSKAWSEEHKLNPTAALKRSGQPEEIVTAALYLASSSRVSPPVDRTCRRRNA